MGIALAIGAVLGVRAASGNFVIWAIVVIALSCSILAALPRTTWPVFACLAAGCTVGVALGVWRAPQAPSPLPQQLPQTFSATVIDDPLTITGGSLATLRWIGPDGEVRSTATFLPPAPIARRGDQILARLASSSGPPVQPLAVEAIVIVEPADGLEALRTRLRSGIQSRLDRRVQGAPGVLALGLLIGDDSSLTVEQRGNLRSAGLSHITAVSGWNVTVVVSAIAAAFAVLHLRGFFWTFVQLLGLGAFVWIVGFDPPVVRAAIMCLAVFAARFLGRPAHSITLLALAAAAMVCVSPELLASASFQLTVAATAGLLVAGAIAATRPDWWWKVASVALTAAFAGIATAPILATSFGTLSVVGIPANLAVAPLIVIAAFASLSAAILAPVPLVGIATGTVAWMLNAAILRASDLFAAVPYGNWQFAPLSTAGQVGIFTAFILIGGALTPEGRLMRRHVETWWTHAPAACVLSLTGATVALGACIATL